MTTNDPKTSDSKKPYYKAKTKKGQTQDGPPKPKMMPFYMIYKYCTPTEKAIAAFGVISAVCAGLTSPFVAVIMGNVLQTFSPDRTADQIHEDIIKLIKDIAIISSILWVFAYFQYAFMQHMSERLSFGLRGRYLAALLTQETAFFEKQSVESLPSQISEYFASISLGTGEKVGQLIYSIAMFFGGLGIAFWKGPIFTLICMTYIPIMMSVIVIFGRGVKLAQVAKLGQIEELGSHTEETLSAIKLIVSFAQEGLTIQRYDEIAEKTRKIALKAAQLQGSMLGAFLFLMFVFYLYTYAIASVLIQKSVFNPTTGAPYTISEIIAVTTGVQMAMMTFGGVIPIMPQIMRALICAQKVFDVIERKPLIASSAGSTDVVSLESGITFKDISFRYPTQIDTARDIFHKASFEIKAGQSTAIVGPSGSGKSTIVQLLNRYYDVSEGTIHFDQTNLIDVNLKSLRETIGYVSQEPVLILGTIRENLMFGNKDATEADMKRALEMASAQFVETMEKGVDTYVGAGSVMNLSGGQKQRIAIARALIKNPKILVLDEATSALDSKSEQEVQAAIDKIQAEQGSSLTIIMIAHRLSTIVSAQNLLYLEDNNSVLSGVKGTAEYDKLIQRLTQINYKHQENNSEASPEDIKAKIISSSMNQDTAKKTNQIASIDAEDEKQVAIVDEKDIIFNENKHLHGVGYGRIMSYYNPKFQAILMLLCACVNSCSFPILGLVVAKFSYIMIGLITKPNDTAERNSWALYWFLVCLGIGLICGLEKILFGVMGENLTFEVRKELLRGIIYKQLSWFDRENRAPGILTNILSEDISTLNGMTTETLSTVIEAALGLILGLAISLAYCWQQSLLVLCVSPVLLVGVVAMSRLQWGNKGGKAAGSTKEADAYEKSNALLTDVILNYKTVISFGDKNVKQIIQKFEDLLVEPSEKRIKNAHIAGLFFGYSQSSRMIFIGIVFWIGSQVIHKWGYNPQDVYTCIWVVFSAAMGAGVSMSNIPSVGRAKASAVTIFSIIDDKSQLDVREASKSAIQKVEVGQIDFVDVNFRYPTRNLLVLNNFNMQIPATFKIALVGTSGCGKSTITNLLLRFYDIQSGKILIDGHELQDYNIQTLRRQIGFVMQEPILFNQTIKDNVLYGKPDATDEQVRKVCEQANALQFIESNYEELTKEERLAFVKREFTTVLNDLSATNISFQALDVYANNEDMADLIIQIFKKADEIALSYIYSQPKEFIGLFEELSHQKGQKWDDVCAKHEWTCQIKIAIANLTAGADAKRILESSVQSLSYKFDETVIDTWLKCGKVTLETFKEQIQQADDRMRALSQKRLEELTDNFMKKKSNEPLHEGFNKMCGLKGCKLSGGQKQRIAIARALIKNPKILILDEATSALDEQSQEIVQQALDRAMEGRTSIVIAHRLSTIRNCQLLFVLNQGKIVEQGTFDQLSNDKDSYFFKLKAGMEM